MTKSLLLIFCCALSLQSGAANPKAHASPTASRVHDLSLQNIEKSMVSDIKAIIYGAALSRNRVSSNKSSM
jgi:hypothetical protein